ncbi:MAG: hypothetical protein ACKO7P_03350, partial [Bacteroidota bacterium]
MFKTNSLVNYRRYSTVLEHEYPPLHFGWTLLGAYQGKPNCFATLFYAFILHSNLRLDSVYGIKKPEPNDSGFPCSGD